jgi:hypothetical protein
LTPLPLALATTPGRPARAAECALGGAAAAATTAGAAGAGAGGTTGSAAGRREATRPGATARSAARASGAAPARSTGASAGAAEAGGGLLGHHPGIGTRDSGDSATRPALTGTRARATSVTTGRRARRHLAGAGPAGLHALLGGERVVPRSRRPAAWTRPHLPRGRPAARAAVAALGRRAVAGRTIGLWPAGRTIGLWPAGLRPPGLRPVATGRGAAWRRPGAGARRARHR